MGDMQAGAVFASPLDGLIGRDEAGLGIANLGMQGGSFLLRAGKLEFVVAQVCLNDRFLLTVCHNEFVAFAKAHPEYKFLVTQIGCGIAGFSAREMAPLFSGAIDVENIILPRKFVDVLQN